jgi:hypothetical protein
MIPATGAAFTSRSATNGRESLATCLELMSASNGGLQKVLTMIGELLSSKTRRSCGLGLKADSRRQISRRYARRMDLTAKFRIARTEQRIAVLRNLIAVAERKGRDTQSIAAC